MSESRRHRVAFDPDHFQRQAEHGRTVEPLDAFRHAYRSNLWRGESVSGPGSTREQTAVIRRAIPDLCERLGVRRLLDVPCGDYSWMREVALPGVTYVGGDLLPEVIAQTSARYGSSERSFVVLDLVTSELPEADLLLCRDCLVHLSHADVLAALENLRASRIEWLLTTTFPDEPVNIDIVTGDWRPIDLTQPPFGLPAPRELIVEECTEQDGAFADKSLGLWRVEDL